MDPNEVQRVINDLNQQLNQKRQKARDLIREAGQLEAEAKSLNREAIVEATASVNVDQMLKGVLVAEAARDKLRAGRENSEARQKRSESRKLNAEANKLESDLALLGNMNNDLISLQGRIENLVTKLTA